MYDLSIIIPTYNEKENIVELIREIKKTVNTQCELVVVDDNSPDGTAQIVMSQFADSSDVRVITRTTDKGLSQAVVEGFRQARANMLVVIDADFSHPIELIPVLYQKIVDGADIAIGSRYMKGGGIEQWPLKRRIVSFGATFLGRIMFPHVTDPVSGFFAIRRSVIDGVTLRPSGYKILLEILGKGKYEKVVEVPYTFKNRKQGSSKLGFKQIREYAFQVFDLISHAIKHRDNQVWAELTRIGKFAIVGLSGIFINIISLYLIVELNLASLYIAWLFAIESSILSNFILNDIWTFSDLKNNTFVKRLYSFHVVSILGVVINFIIFFLLTSIGVWYIVAEVIAIFCAFAFNFLLNRRRTWAG